MLLSAVKLCGFSLDDNEASGIETKILSELTLIHAVYIVNSYWNIMKGQTQAKQRLIPPSKLRNKYD